jgi:hypothetical protein
MPVLSPTNRTPSTATRRRQGYASGKRGCPCHHADHTATASPNSTTLFPSYTSLRASSPPPPCPPTRQVLPGVWLRVAAPRCIPHHLAEGCARAQRIEDVGQGAAQHALDAAHGVPCFQQHLEGGQDGQPRTHSGLGGCGGGGGRGAQPGMQVGGKLEGGGLGEVPQPADASWQAAGAGCGRGCSPVARAVDGPERCMHSARWARRSMWLAPTL